MKKTFLFMLSICLFLFGLALMPEKTAQAENSQPEEARLTSKSITIVKGQYAFVGLLGADVTGQTGKVKWSVEGDHIKIHTTKAEDGQHDCYVKAVKAGKGTLKCTVHKKTLKCRVKVLNHAAFIGDFCDDSGEIYLDIFKSGRQYVACYSQLRLCTMDRLKGTVKNGILSLKGKDPAGNPITVTVSQKGAKRILTFKETTWEYFEEGSSVELKKCSAKKRD